MNWKLGKLIGYIVGGTIGVVVAFNTVWELTSPLRDINEKRAQVEERVEEIDNRIDNILDKHERRFDDWGGK